MPDAPLRFRPHHFLCSLGFQGKGYSDLFTANMERIVNDQLRASGGDDVQIEVVGATDDICGPCPKRRGTLCTSQDKITTLDTRHARALGLSPGTRITWRQAKQRIVDNITPGALTHLCAGCQWLELGLCETALRQLHETA